MPVNDRHHQRVVVEIAEPIRLVIEQASADLKLDLALSLLKEIKTQGEHMAGEIARLTTEVAETRTVIDSAVVTLENLSAFIREHADDPAALNKFADDLDAGQSALAAAIANVPPTK